MKLTDYLGSALDAPIAAVRRQAISIAIALVCAIAAIILLISASVVALEPFAGLAGARLAVAVALLIIAGLAVMLPRFFRKEGFVARAQKEADEMPRDQKIAMIIEALMLGFSMSSSTKKSQSK